MKRVIYLLTHALLFLLISCDVHEWPEIPESVKTNLRLNYETEMTEWEHRYDGTSVVEEGYGSTYVNHLDYGVIRYSVRIYPVLEKQRMTQDCMQEVVLTKDVVEGYDQDIMLELPSGNYNVMVWSDLMQTNTDKPFYNAENFAEITLQGDHMGNTDHRDAFRGSSNLSVVADVMARPPEVLDVAMQRPLAKFEILTTDLKEFVDKELAFLQKEAAARGEISPPRVNTDDYRVVFYYSGFMPNTYNMNTDKPIDSETGVMFESKLKILSENDASLGFDYVFVNGKQSAISIQIGLYDKEDRQLALSDPVDVPLRRNHHTILKGSFLMQQTSGGITINPDFDGNHNILIE